MLTVLGMLAIVGGSLASKTFLPPNVYTITIIEPGGPFFCTTLPFVTTDEGIGQQMQNVYTVSNCAVLTTTWVVDADS